MDCSITEQDPPLHTHWHQHLVSTLLGAAGGLGGASCDDAGNRAVALERPAASGHRTELLVRRYRPDGEERDAPIMVACREAPLAMANPALGLGPGGHLVVAWHEHDVHCIVARRFDADGTPVGEPFVVNSSSEAVPRLNPMVAVNAAGAFVVLWEHGWTHLRARLFGPNGAPFGPEIDMCLARRTTGTVF